MSKVDLFSREWCGLIFQNRNQEYGAYKLRKEVGKRYRRALFVLFLVIFLVFGVPLGIHLYMKYQLYRAFSDFSKELPHLKRKEAAEGHEVKAISTGRARPTKTTIKGATDQIPDLVEVTKQDIIFGEGGPETFIVDEDLYQEWEDLDSLHNRDRIDLPIEGPQIIKVDAVEVLPIFPGGIPALMEWLESNIPYPPSAYANKVQGDMEVTFLVGVDGRVTEVHLTKPLNADLDRLVLSAFKRMPRWTPGKRDGHPVLVSVSLPIHFESGRVQP